jgi:multiple sugar transport system substrate-binding protein
MPGRWKSGLAAATLVVALAGCGGSSNDGPSTGGGAGTGAGTTGAVAKPTADQTLTIMGFGPGDEIANTRAELATKAIAPAKVKNPKGAFDGQQFLAAVAANKPPDVVYLDRQRLGTYAAKGVFMPLTDCIKNQSIDMSQFRTPAVTEVTYKGAVYGIPEFFDNRALMINDSVAKAAGVDPSAISTTDWNALAGQVKQMTKKSGNKLSVIGFDPKMPEFLPLWAKANGVDLLSADGTKAQLDNPKLVEALDYAVSLINDQGGWNPFKAFRDTWDFFGAGNEYAKKQTGGFPMEDWYLNVLASTSPDVKLTVAPFTDRQGKPIDWATGMAWAIPRGAKNPELACTWAKTMTDASSWVAAAKVRAAAAKKNKSPFTGLYTANKAADQQIMADVYRPISPQYDKAVQTILTLQDSAFSLPASPAGEEFQQIWQDAVNRVLTGEQTAAEAMGKAQDEAQSAIDAANR